jgi:hypothetical protein
MDDAAIDMTAAAPSCRMSWYMTDPLLCALSEVETPVSRTNMGRLFHPE